MKKIIIMVSSLVLAMACDESAIDPLEGKYPAPESIELKTVAEKSETKTESGSHIFSLGLSNGEGTFSAMFTAEKYFLVPQTYTFADQAGANGTYADASWNGTGVKSGDIKVAKNGDNYEIKGALTLTDDKVIRIHFSGEIIYEAVIEATVLSNLLSAGAGQTLDDGSTVITIKAGTSGTTATMTQYGIAIGGSGKYISIDFVCSGGKLDAGTYTPAANGSAKAGNYVMGYDTEMWGMSFTNWGTCWFTVDGENTSGIHIETGDITVKNDNGIYTITVKNDDVFAEYKGEIAL